MNDKILIAIIDSGINSKNEKLKKHIRQGYSIKMLDNRKTVIEQESEDEFGHGTNCADIILKNIKYVEFIPIKIVNNSGFSNAILLLHALKLCLNIPVKIISVSLSVIMKECKLEIELYNVCKELEKQGKIVCVSEDNNYINSIPARFDNVIGVRGIENMHLRIFSHELIQVIGDGGPEFALNATGTYNVFRGNSKANAKVVGEIAQILLYNPYADKNKVLRLLEKKYSRITYIRDHNTLNKIPTIKAVWNIAKEICYIINREQNKHIDVIELFQVPIMCPITGYTYFNIYNLLKQIEKYYGIEFAYECLKVEDICTLYNLSHYIYGELL